ncbi:MAG TPA: hypothetical protein VHO48_07725 [Anaerolineaceae bacterium]|nr:hypothetical protein [Anaerolineaceae bacterium]
MENPPVSSRDVGIRLKDQPAQPLLSTKLFTPPLRFHLVSRRRLLSRLQQAPQYPLTLICAPAGYGKTTLLAEWLAEDPAVSGLARVGWLSLDEEDNDPTRFLAYVIAAIEKVCPEVTRDAQAYLRSPQPPPIQTILVVLINSLQNLTHLLWLVLDDYHFITNREIHTSLTFLLEHLPARFHLVIATRSDPPLPLHRLRASNRLLELRSDDLRFTTEETTTFINQVMALCLSPDDILTLENRTEGWIAGLQMAALSMQGLEDRAAFVRDFGGSHRFVLEYLI